MVESLIGQQILYVDVWADFVCPWCYLGEQRFLLALSRFEQADHVKLRRHAFELDPGAAACSQRGTVDVIAIKYGISAEKARRLEAQLERMCSAVGLEYRVDRVPANTHAAHRLYAAALESSQALAESVARRLYRAHFVEGVCIGQRETLLGCAKRGGMSGETAERTLTGDAYTAAVGNDRRRAVGLGAEGVPFFVFDRRLAVSGGQESSVFLQALHQAWSTLAHDDGE